MLNLLSFRYLTELIRMAIQNKQSSGWNDSGFMYVFIINLLNERFFYVSVITEATTLINFFFNSLVTFFFTWKMWCCWVFSTFTGDYYGWIILYLWTIRLWTNGATCRYKPVYNISVWHLNDLKSGFQEMKGKCSFQIHLMVGLGHVWFSQIET